MRYNLFCHVVCIVADSPREMERLHTMDPGQSYGNRNNLSRLTPFLDQFDRSQFYDYFLLLIWFKKNFKVAK